MLNEDYSQPFYMDNPVEEEKRITYTEFVKLLSLLGVWVEQLEKRIEGIENLLDFWGSQILKVRADVYLTNKKTPFRRIEELEESIKGMNAYYQERLAEMATPYLDKKKVKYNKYV